MTQWHIDKPLFLLPPPAPHLVAQLCLIRLNSIPQLPIRTLHLTRYLAIYVQVSRFDRDGVVTGFLCAIGSGELDLKAFGEHGEGVPGPDDGAVVGACCEVLPVRSVEAEGWIGDEDADGGEEAGWECKEDGGAKGVDRLKVLGHGYSVGRVD